MTTPLDSSSQAQTPDNPSGGSASQNGQPSSETFTLTKAQWDSLQGDIQTLKSGTQSEKDRAVRRTNERMDRLEGDIRPMLERALQHTASGKSAEEALRLVQSEQDDNQTKQALAEFAAAWKSGKLPEGFGVGSAQTQGVDVAKVLADYQLDPKDPYVAGKLSGRTFAAESDVELLAARIIRERMSIQTNPAQTSALTGINTSSSASELDAVYLQYEAAVKTASQNPELVESLEKRMKELGG